MAPEPPSGGSGDGPGDRPSDDGAPGPDLRAVLHDRIRERSTPVVLQPAEVVPAASLWVGSRHWVTAFREAGIGPGDRVVLALPPGAIWAQVMIAAWWVGATLAPVDPVGEPRANLERLDGRVVVAFSEGPATLVPDDLAGPVRGAMLRPAGDPTPQVALVVHDDGVDRTIDAAGLLAVLDATVAEHRPEAQLQVSTSPWWTPRGAVLDATTGLLGGAYLTVVDMPVVEDLHAELRALETNVWHRSSEQDAELMAVDPELATRLRGTVGPAVPASRWTGRLVEGRHVA